MGATVGDRNNGILHTRILKISVSTNVLHFWIPPFLNLSDFTIGFNFFFFTFVLHLLYIFCNAYFYLPAKIYQFDVFINSNEAKTNRGRLNFCTFFNDHKKVVRRAFVFNLRASQLWLGHEIQYRKSGRNREHNQTRTASL